MSPALPDQLPRKLQRLLDGKCRYTLCPKPLKEGSCYCDEHDEPARAAAAVRQTKLRTKLAREKLCIDGCGTRVTRSSRGRRCSACAKANRERAAKWREKRECDERAENVTPELRTKLETHRDGYTRVRTTGRGVRGQKSRVELDADLRDDLSDAIRETQAVRDEGIALLRGEHVAALGRVQKREALAVVADRLLRAARSLQSVADELCPGRAREVQAVIGEAVDEE